MKIAIVGAGPRGISTLDQLLLNYKQLQKVHSNLEVIVFDSFGIGGSVWFANQNPLLIMNTPCGQATLFSKDTDDTPDFYNWIKKQAKDDVKRANLSSEHKNRLIDEIKNLTPTDYASRSLFGLYTSYAFHYLTNSLEEVGISVSFINQEVTNITLLPKNEFEVQTSSFTDIFSAVFMATGFPLNSLTKSEVALRDYAKENDLTYLSSKNPSLSDLSNIKKDDTVILRGLGLTFYDYVTLLTQGRGGKFTKSEDHYIYHKSGDEPIIYGFSRRGYPSHAKGIYQRSLDETMTPQFLTITYLKTLEPYSLSYKEFMTLFVKDLTFTYYSVMLPNYDKKTLISKIDDGTLESDIKSELPANKIFDFDQLTHPEKELSKADLKNFDQTIANFLLTDALNATEGNQNNPIATTLEMIRDLRQSIRYIVENHLFKSKDYVESFIGQFKSLNNFLAAGPAVKRLFELEALINAEVVKLMAPPVEFKAENGKFILKNDYQKITSDHLIESRLPKESVISANDSVYQNLLQKDLRPHYLMSNDEKIETGAIDVDQLTNQALNQNGDMIANLFIWGLPTEGIHFQTTTVAQNTPNNFFLTESKRMMAKLIDNLNK